MKSQKDRIQPFNLFYPNNVRAFILFCFVLVNQHIAATTLAPRLHVKNYNIEQGLSLGTVSSITTTPDGFLWVATEDGLNRFDGYEFKIYKRLSKQISTIPDNLIYTVFTDTKGRLWVGTDAGAAYKTTDSNDFVKIIESNHQASKPSVKQFSEDIYGRIWILSEGQLFIFNESNSLMEEFRSVFPGTAYQKLSEIESIQAVGSSLFFSIGPCIFGFDLISYQFKEHCFKDKLGAHAYVNTLRSDGSNLLWIGTNRGVYRFNLLNGETNPFYELNLSSGLAETSIQDIWIESNQVIWIATSNGLFRFRIADNEIDIFKENLIDRYSLSSRDITTVFKDGFGQLWIGSYGGGLYVWNELSAQFTHVLAKSQVREDGGVNNVHALTSDELDNLWISTVGGGIFVYDSFNNELTKVNNKQLDKLYTQALTFDAFKRLWIGTLDGLFYYLPDKNQAYKISDERFEDLITSIKEDRVGNLWVTTSNSIYKIDISVNNNVPITQVKDYSSLIFDEALLEDLYLTNSFVDLKGNLWIGTSKGLVYYQLKSNKTHVFVNDSLNEQSISNDFVQDIFEDTQGVLWIATGEGLNRLIVNSDKIEEAFFIRYLEDDGLANNSIYGILQDAANNLWLSTSYGLSMFNVSNLKFTNFKHADGLQGSEFNMWARHQLAHNKVAFAGTNGVTIFSTRQIIKNKSITPIRLISAALGNEKLPVVNNKIEIPQTSEKLLSITVAGVNFLNAPSQQYRYRLVGVSADWVDLGYQRNINLFGLESGQYYLDIQVSQNGKDWQNQSLTLTLDVRGSFLTSSMAKIFYIFLLTVLLSFLTLLVVKRLKQQKANYHSTLDKHKNRVKNLESNLNQVTEKLLSQQSHLSEYKERVDYFEKRILSFKRKDPITQFYERSYFESLINKEDRYLIDNHIKYPKGMMVCISIDNYHGLLRTEHYSNVEAAIGNFSMMIKDYINGDDLVCRWNENQFVMLESGEIHSFSSPLQSFYQLIKSRPYDCGNGKLLQFDFIITVLNTPIFPEVVDSTSRIQSAHVSIDFINWLSSNHASGLFMLKVNPEKTYFDFERSLAHGMNELLELEVLRYEELKFKEIDESEVVE